MVRPLYQLLPGGVCQADIQHHRLPSSHGKGKAHGGLPHQIPADAGHAHGGHPFCDNQSNAALTGSLCDKRRAAQVVIGIAHGAQAHSVFFCQINGPLHGEVVDQLPQAIAAVPALQRPKGRQLLIGWPRLNPSGTKGFDAGGQVVDIVMPHPPQSGLCIDFRHGFAVLGGESLPLHQVPYIAPQI